MSPTSYANQIVLRADSDPTDTAMTIAAEVGRSGSVTVTLRTGDQLAADVVDAAVEAASLSPDVSLYVVGYGADLHTEAVTRFSFAQHLNVNARKITNLDFLVKFTALRSLILQTGSRTVALDFLTGMRQLTRLSLGGPVRGAKNLVACRQLKYLHCSSNAAVISALPAHPSLRYLDIAFGSYRDLSAVASIPTLRGVALYQVANLDGEDLAPLGECKSLTAVSLGALKHVAHLEALTSGVRHSLRAVLLENMSNLVTLSGLSGCGNLQELGLYGSRPKDQSLTPLRNLNALAHLVLGDPYPKSEIEELKTWYTGALWYRGIGPNEFRPRWRTPIDRLGPQVD